ncbi:hypothetical protein PVL29_002439 [Vitis rotundifolia]|uniref:Uncharacterized protein n=1 Tax=Vitis rotundifolia TaxID=103349 RepID=A0AA39AGW7_VITRO|nr:hypothetical protein PVL29_002439 [Vitis rotundifolia]
MESLGVIKGAWSQEVDVPLRKCVEKYGEGKRHLVPPEQFAGLNRCPKSCRLRWVNYLKPDIKRGEFALDKVDLVIRLHNLLGNRQTANDVKNYWHTHHFKKKVQFREEGRNKPQTHSKTKVLKALALQVLQNLAKVTSSKPSSTSQQPNDDIIWWESLLDGHAQRDQETDFSTRSSGDVLISSLWTEETATETKRTTDCMVEQIQGGEGDFPFDVGFWDVPTHK